MKRFSYLLYPLVLIAFTLFSYAFVDRNLFYLENIYTGFATDQKLATTLIYITLIILLYTFYLIFLFLINKGKIVRQDIIFLIIVTMGILIFSYPAMLSYDIFNYLTTAKVSFFYHENPYVIMPIEFTNEPFLLFTRAANKIALYGPVWVGLTSIPYFFGFGKFLLILLNFKLFVSLFYLGTVFLLWKISKNILTVSLFALNPLVIVETLISGHNDIVMMFLALLSYFFLMKKNFWFGSLFLLLSIGIKYATVILVVIFLYIFLQTMKNKKIEWINIYMLSSVFMLFVLFLAPLREEIYPWYGIWFLTFGVFLAQRYNYLLSIYLAFSFGLLLSYTPFMLFGTYSGSTPILKTILMFLPVFVVTILPILYKEKIWRRLKIYSH